jgi:hypothetical protein
MTIKPRLVKAREAARQTVGGFADYKNVRRYALRSLSDAAQHYQIGIHWHKCQTADFEHLQARCECHRITGVGQEPCQGNSNGTLCYHVLAALIRGAENGSKRLVLFDNFTDAFRYANFGGKLMEIKSLQGQGRAWGVVR